MLLVSLTVCSLLALIFLFRRQSRTAEPEPVRLPRNLPFGGVDLIPGDVSCARAKKLSEERILVSEAPVLPLPGCSKRCRCTYRKLNADRRDTNRRRGDDGLPEHFIYSGAEKRAASRREAAQNSHSQ